MFTWKIEWMEVSKKPIEGFDEVVLTAGWLCIATDGQYKVSEFGSVGFAYPQTDSVFIPYNSLTESEVLNWTWSSGINKEEVEAALLTRLNDLKTPPTAMLPLPWAVKE